VAIYTDISLSISTKPLLLRSQLASPHTRCPQDFFAINSAQIELLDSLASEIERLITLIVVPLLKLKELPSGKLLRRRMTL